MDNASRVDNSDRHVDERCFPGTHALKDPDRAALVLADTGDSVSFAELDATANRLARAFRHLGLEPAAHVAICMENRLELPIVTWGAHYAGLHYTVFSTRLTAEEAGYIITDSGSAVVVLSPQMATRLLPELRSYIGDHVRILTVGDADGQLPDLMTVAADYSPDSLPDAVEGCDMLYSSGTTGRPKGVLRQFTGAPLGTTCTVGKLGQALVGMGPDTVYLSPAPLYHAAPLKWVMENNAIGGTSVIMERFDAAAVLAAIERYRVTHAQFVPTMFVRMLRLPEDVRAAADVSSLQAAIHAAAPCPRDVKQSMIDWWGPIVYEYYAGTEGCGFCWCTSSEWLAHPGTVGRPLLGEVHIVGPDGEELPTGDDGLVYFSGGPAFEYHNAPEKTAGAHNPHGWATLGDIGHLDEDGFLYLTDRESNMIISGGVNIYPQEAENVLAAHPAVLDVAVIGVPNEEFGEEVKAVVQLVDGVPPRDELARELIAFCRSKLADVKCPRSVDFRDELPRMPTGKLVKRLLQDEYWAGRDARI